MIRVAVEVREHAVVQRVRTTAKSIERALELRDGKARVIFPIEPWLSFGPKDATGASERHTRLVA